MTAKIQDKIDEQRKQIENWCREHPFWVGGIQLIHTPATMENTPYRTGTNFSVYRVFLIYEKVAKPDQVRKIHMDLAFNDWDVTNIPAETSWFLKQITARVSIVLNTAEEYIKENKLDRDCI